MRISRLACVALGMSALLLCAARAHAGLITLNNSGNQSLVEAHASDDDLGLTTIGNVDSLPYTTPATVTDGATSSTTTPNLSTSALTASFDQSYLDDNSGAEGHIDIFFTANSNLTYTINGIATVIGNFDEGLLKCSLKDITASTTVYSDQESFMDTGNTVRPAVLEDTNVLNLSNASDQTGSMTGSLIGGHTYEFYLQESTDDIFDDPTLTGNGGVTVSAQSTGGSSVPLPRSAPAALFGLVPLAMLWNKRRIATCPAR